MARKKKEVKPVETETIKVTETVEEVTTTSETKEETIEALTVPHVIKPTIKTKESYLFQITALTDSTRLYKNTSLKESEGKLKKGQVCNVVCEINYAPIKMYKLSNGYYIIADQNIKKL